MNLEEELKSAAENFCRMKHEMCRIEHGPQDLSPMLHFKYKHLSVPCGIVIMGNPFQMVPPAWRKVLDDGIPEFMMLMVEGYASRSPMDYEKGAMEHDFKNNPDSEVVEVITIQAIEIDTGKQMVCMVEYKYGDDGLPQFGDANIGACEGPAMNSNVAEMFKSCRDATVGFFERAAS